MVIEASREARAEAAPKSRKHSTEKPHAGSEAVTGSRQTKLECAEVMGRRLAEAATETNAEGEGLCRKSHAGTKRRSCGRGEMREACEERVPMMKSNTAITTVATIMYKARETP